MSLDIYFPEHIARALLSLSRANARAMTLARRYGADEHIIGIAAASYQAALDDVATAFGLQYPERLMILDMREVGYYE
jgi:hypothetical protein